MNFREFFESLSSVEQDRLRETLSDISSEGSESKIGTLEVELKTVHTQINDINSGREHLSSKLSSVELVLGLLDDSAPIEGLSNLEIEALREVFHAYAVELKQAIENSKPTKDLKEKYLIREQIRSMKNRSRIVDEMLRCMDGDRETT